MDVVRSRFAGVLLYQTANRLALLLWLRDRGVDAWLCHPLFLNDPLHHPTTRKQWEAGLELAEKDLGIESIELPFAGHAFLDALDPAQELAAAHG